MTKHTGLVNEFQKELSTISSNSIESAVQKIAIRFDRKICEFATERKTKKVYTFKKMRLDGNHCTADYRFFDETEEDMVHEFAKSNQYDFQIIDFSHILNLSDEEFERIIGSMHNADVAKAYRKVMKGESF